MTADAGRTAVERYFTEMGEIYRSGGGTEETSYYSAFENLANAIGKDLTQGSLHHAVAQHWGGQSGRGILCGRAISEG